MDTKQWDVRNRAEELVNECEELEKKHLNFSSTEVLKHMVDNKGKYSSPEAAYRDLKSLKPVAPKETPSSEGEDLNKQIAESLKRGRQAPEPSVTKSDLSTKIGDALDDSVREREAK